MSDADRQRVAGAPKIRRRKFGCDRLKIVRTTGASVFIYKGNGHSIDRLLTHGIIFWLPRLDILQKIGLFSLN